MTESSTLICFDYGRKRIGVAVGQTVTGTATPLETVSVEKGVPDWERIAEILRKWRPHALLVGDPVNLDGSSQPMSLASDRFVRQLSARFDYPVYRIDERLSSYEARARLKDTRNLDPVAAQVILETWLSEHTPDTGKNDTIVQLSADDRK